MAYMAIFDTGTFSVYDRKEDADRAVAFGRSETGGNVSGVVIPTELLRAAPALLLACTAWCDAYEAGELEKYDDAFNASRRAILAARGAS